MKGILLYSATLLFVLLLCVSVGEATPIPADKKPPMNPNAVPKKAKLCKKVK
jgi:hypothetical protein